ncbi:hypothetical protein BWD42_17990 [Sphingobacterium sp. CZ-UAM]|jgi:hypothetical protein|uniref:hypothetical protein n=1 Tax=unclassified Sphingobacterium TaxID=2609468 RepID=UPI000986C9C6|nr:hypothetical protein [Sphingobacterium sp. CZ-UAM]OOG16713.1 hypothetical protein BWD42_17990 [Sphingobacterium sp. CZ-UAM]
MQFHQYTLCNFISRPYAISSNNKELISHFFKQLDKFESYQQLPTQKILVYGGNQTQKRTNYLVKSWMQAADGAGY